MIVNNQYNFREGKLGVDFARENLKNFKQTIEAGVSFVTMSMPGVGASYFLKYLACQKWAYFVHVDLYTLPTLNQHEFYRMFLRNLKGNPDGKSDEQVFIESKAIIKDLAQKNEKVVIIFSRFDQLKNDFNTNFLSNLQSLTTIQSNKIVLIFTSIKPLDEIAPDAITGGNLTFYSKILYFKPYSKEDLKKLLKLDPAPITSRENLDRLIELSGGHNQLLHILLNSQKQQNLLLDRFVKMQLKELVDYLDYHQRKQIQKIALRQALRPRAQGRVAQGKNFGEIDEYLLGVGMITPAGKVFTPLLADYIKQNLPVKLPMKEARLFKLLRKNMGRTVTKDEIFQEVWPASPDGSQGGGEGSEDATDWALDALIYRLRKHSFITSQSYIIESHKKVGYTLVQT